MVAGFLGRVARRIIDTRSPAAAGALPASTGAPPADLARAVAAHEAGRLEEARASYLAVLAADARNAVACGMLGVLSQQTNDGEGAVAWITRALDIDPDNVVARGNLGLVYLSMGRLEQAETQLRKAIELQPAFDNAHASLALVLRERGDLAGAETELSRALALNPRNVDARNNLGSLCKDSGRLDAAETHYRQALELRPQSASIWQNLGAVAMARGRWLDAASCYRAAIDIDSRSADAWSSLGHALGRAGRVADAESACRQALALRPNWPDALVNLAAVLKGQHDAAAAEEQCRRAIELDPRHAGAWAQLGTLRQEQHDSIDAEACYRRAIELDPNLASARYNLGTMLLLHRRYKEGFALVESRFAAFPQLYAFGVRASLARDVQRRWHGEPLSGRRLLVWSEQGFGDSLMMLRFLPLPPTSGVARVTLLCEGELRRIAERIPGIDVVVDANESGELPDFDLHCPAMSLPSCLGVDADSVTPAAPYIGVPADAKARWDERLGDGGALRVGIAWAGSPTLRDDARRSIALSDCAALARTSGVQWVSLQKGAAAAQISQWPGPILDLMNECEDFADTAALIACLDLVVAVDTAVVHLAGAMGKPVWLLNRAGSEWRWGVTGDASPWYPSVRIFRQEQSLDWRHVMDEVAVELDRLRRRQSVTSESRA